MKKLSWKIASVTGLIIIFVILTITFPLYWQTRETMENQLALHMKSNILLLKNELDYEKVNFLVKFPSTKSIKESLNLQFQKFLTVYSAKSIYLVDEQGKILVTTGNKQSSIKSVMLHNTEISKTLAGKIITSPLFSDNSGKYYKSVFCSITLDNDIKLILALDADAIFLKDIALLRKKMVYTSAIILLLSIISSLLLSKTLTRPLEKITDYARDIGSGINRSSNMLFRKDEIGILGKTIETMQSKIKQRESDNKQLLASVAHEIKNPLAAMKVNCELLVEESIKQDKLTKYSSTVLKEINQLAEIVESFLAYARPVEINLVNCNLEEFITDIKEDLFKEYGNLEFSITGNCQVKIHPVKMRHVFSNLIQNAIEASVSKPKIDINIKPGKKYILITFKNYGSSIPEKLKPQIFEAFYTTKENGVGLGLSIAKSIVEQHGGSIFLTNSDKSGTEFVIKLLVS